MARLVGNPFLIDLFIEARQHPHHLRPARIDADVAALRIHHIDGFGLAQFPGPRVEGIRLGGQRAHRAQIHHIAGQFAGEGLFQIGGDFHVLAAAGGAQIGHARDFGGEAHAAGALDAAGHDGLDQRAHIFVFDRALVLVEAVERGAAIAHRLVLQIAFAALVADRAIQRMIDQQEFHHPFARLAGIRRSGVDLGGRAVLVGEDVLDLQARSWPAAWARPPIPPGTCGNCRPPTGVRESRSGESPRPPARRPAASVMVSSASISLPSTMSLRVGITRTFFLATDARQAPRPSRTPLRWGHVR